MQLNAGFTLVEVLVAIFLFGLAFTATISVLTMNERSATAIKNNFVASGLAQEGLEVVRNIRDRDWFLDNPPGINPFGAFISADGTYRIQWDSQTLLNLESNPNLRRDTVTGIFSYNSGSDTIDTIFKRTVDIKTEVPDVEIRVIVNVTWIERGGALKSVSAEDHLFNWK